VIRHAFDWFCLEGRGYQFWSGIGGYLTVAGVLWRSHNCYVLGCHRLGHVNPDHGHRPVCRKHR